MRFPCLSLVTAAALSALGCSKEPSPAPTNLPPAPAPAPVLDIAPANPAAAKRELTLTYFTMAA